MMPTSVEWLRIVIALNVIVMAALAFDGPVAQVVLSVVVGPCLGLYAAGVWHRWLGVEP